MTMSTWTPPLGGWKVTNQVEAHELNGAAFVDGWRVYFQTGHGIAGSVFIPAVNYTAENVSAIITATAANLDGIAGLTSEG